MESMKKIDSSQSGSNKRLANAYSSNIKDSELMYLLTSKGNAKVKNDFKDHTKIVSIPNSTKTFIKKKTIISPSIIQSLNLHGFKKPLRSESRIKLFIIIAFINKPNQDNNDLARVNTFLKQIIKKLAEKYKNEKVNV